MNVRSSLSERVDFSAIGPGVAVPVEAYLHWLDRQEGRYEYDRGTIGMMVRVTADHADIVSRLVALLTAQLDIDRFQIFAEAFAVQTGASVRFPDVLVQARSADRKALQANDPLIIVEVVSPSSHHLDTVVKRDEYLALPSLQAYVVASQDEPAADVWLRGEDGTFPSAPLELAGFDAIVALPSLGVTLPLAELYRHMRG